MPFGRRGRIAPEMKGWLSVSHAGRSGFVPIIDSLLKRLAVRAWSTDCNQIVWTNFIRNSLKDRADKVFSLSSEIKTTDLKRKPTSSKSYKNTLKKLIDSKIEQDPVVQRADNAIQWIHRYPADVLTKNTTPSIGWRFMQWLSLSNNEDQVDDC